jgi:sec-independent protein translocase protein TatA
MPSWIGPWEIAIVLVLVLLIFGPRKLPELGSSLGKSIRGFKKGMKEGQDELQQTVAEVKEATDMSDTSAAQTSATTEPVDAGPETPKTE